MKQDRGRSFNFSLFCLSSWQLKTHNHTHTRVRNHSKYASHLFGVVMKKLSQTEEQSIKLPQTRNILVGDVCAAAASRRHKFVFVRRHNTPKLWTWRIYDFLMDFCFDELSRLYARTKWRRTKRLQMVEDGRWMGEKRFPFLRINVDCMHDAKIHLPFGRTHCSKHMGSTVWLAGPGWRPTHDSRAKWHTRFHTLKRVCTMQ